MSLRLKSQEPHCSSTLSSQLVPVWVRVREASVRSWGQPRLLRSFPASGQVQSLPRGSALPLDRAEADRAEADQAVAEWVAAGLANSWAADRLSVLDNQWASRLPRSSVCRGKAWGCFPVGRRARTGAVGRSRVSSWAGLDVWWGPGSRGDWPRA